MKLYKINSERIDNKILRDSITVLENGGLIIYPTDTAYGIGCDASNARAVEKIKALKKRKEALNWPIIVGNLKMAKDIFIFTKKEKKLALRFWPQNLTSLDKLRGKLSLVLQVKKNKGKKLAFNVFAPDHTVAVRIPNCLWSRAISLALDKPIISTSANLSGSPACYSLGEIKKSFGRSGCRSVGLILDAGKIKRNRPSTVARFSKGKLELLREGIIAHSDIINFLQ